MSRDDTGSRTEADAAAHEHAYRPSREVVDPDQPPHIRLVSDPDPAEIYTRLIALQREAS
jgi:hypothetical protein